jgi:type IV fimbrial biogenesis protein FimT
MRSSNATGFSLIELLIVIAVIMILTLLSIPNFADWLQNSRTRSVAESLQNGLRFAQAEAARLSRQTTFTTVTPNWTVDFVPVPAAGDPTLTTLRTSPIGNLDNVTIALTPAGTVIGFNSFGRAFSVASGVFTPLAADASFLVANSNGSRTLKVLISPSGKVHMCDPAKTFAADTPDGCPPI